MAHVRRGHQPQQEGGRGADNSLLPSALQVQLPLMARAPERLLLVLFAVAIVVLIADAALSYHAIRTITENQNRVTRSEDILDELNITLSLMKDAETGQRGYLLTGDERYLAPYTGSAAAVQSHLARLKDLMTEPVGSQRLQPALEQHIHEKFTELEASLQAYRDRGRDAALAIVRTGRGREAMEQVRVLVGDMIDRERSILATRTIESANSGRVVRVTAVIVGMLAIMLLGILYYQTQRGMDERLRLLAQERDARADAEAAYRSEQEARQTAEHASRLKDEFLATVSHELRTPLNAMLGWIVMLRGGRLDADASAHAMDIIERNARSQAQLVEDLLDSSRIMSGKLRLSMDAVDLTTVLAAAIDAVRPAADAKHIAILSSAGPGALTVSGDAARLQQVLWNLLSNAVKFTPRGGRVEVRAVTVATSVHVSVSDTGEGIDPEFLPHVFQLFRQADSSMSRAQGGLGLGLAIVRSLVEMHGGSVRADSAGPGQGATFVVELPWLASSGHEEGRPAAVAAAAHEPETALAGVRVLAVDDEDDSRTLVGAALSQAGAEVRVVSNADDALMEVRLWRPDVLVADLGMPGQDGYHLMERLHELDPADGGTTPAIALTAYARVEDRVKTLAAGFRMHVPKPVEPEELVHVIVTVVGRNVESA